MLDTHSRASFFTTTWQSWHRKG